MIFQVLAAAVAVAAGAIASVVGFGIGSLLTPILSVQLGTKLAVAAVAVPHVLGTALRFVVTRRAVDWKVLKSFGLASAAGGLAGALLHTSFSSRGLTIALGLLLVLTGITEWREFAGRVRLSRTGSWIGGLLSGAFGGLVGNQGGVRSAALLTFQLPRDSFIATATLTGLIVDAARTPVYFFTKFAELKAIVGLLALTTAGVLIGTVVGKLALRRIPRRAFGRIAATAVLMLGVYLLLRGN